MGQKVKPVQLDSLPQYWADSCCFEQILPSRDTWWQQFNDTILLSLIDDAVKNNYNIVTAINNVELARTQYKSSLSSFYPDISLQLGYSPTRQSAAMYGFPEITRYGTASLNASWEIDIFGSVRKEAAYYKKSYMATKEQYYAVMVSLCAQVGVSYVNLRTLQKQKEVAYKNLETQKATLDIMEARFRSGLASQLDVSQAKSVYYSTLSTIPKIETAILQQINQIGLLVGDIPWELRKRLLEPKPIPQIVPALTIEIPAQVIRQRPDVRVAELQMDAQASHLGATRRDWFPQFFITGSFGYISNEFKDFFKEKNVTWSVAPAMKWDIFSGTQKYYATEAAKINLDESIENYNNVIRTALQEVDNALISYQQSLLQIVTNKKAFQQAELSLQLSMDLYMKGLQNFQTVVDSQRYVLTYENDLVNSEGTSVTYFIQLYQALGGGYKFENQ